MGPATGLCHTTIRRIWTPFGLQPLRSETFKLSSDPLFVDKVRDIVGLYLSPPNRALVLSVDEKSQIHALDREQPVLPMMPGIPERRTHSYVRHGTTSLFAALNVASGFVIGKCYKRHRATEFLDFLKQIGIIMPPTKPRWSGHGSRRPHYHVHFTPTSASWINQVERWFAELTRKQLRRGVHASPASSRPIFAPSSSATMRTQSPIDGPSPRTKFCRPSGVSVRRPSRSYVANFRFS
ncbi:hypothetical protein X744_29605 [Mesorhizobium sp. LNJC372A00]|nr:hypothetical protein X745_30795 [Mesorhizobium sp. LNJC374B00]ESY52266.1 hypothetical protein X744_29605 [Mesorhizobium sp. LNJC372A00]